MGFSLGEMGKKKLRPSILFFPGLSLLITRNQAILPVECSYYCFVLACNINTFKMSCSSEYVCIKSRIPLRSLNPNFPLLSIVVELITFTEFLSFSARES